MTLRGAARSVTIAALLAAAVVAWQGQVSRQKSFGWHPLPSVSGLALPKKPFVYLYHYAGLFPVSVPERLVEYSRVVARRIVHENGRELAMRPLQGFIWGDWGQMLVYRVVAWWNGSPENLDVRPLHGAAFTFALAAALVSFAFCGRPGVGALFVLLAGSSGFQLFQVHGAQNVWGWTITTNILTLAAFLPILLRRRIRAGPLLALSVASGAFLGTMAHVRPEMMSTAVAAAFAFVWLARKRRRLALTGLIVFASCLVSVRAGWGTYFAAKIRQAQHVVTEAGGRAYHGPMVASHVFWHAVFCGLGDYGQDRGYAWDDRVAGAFVAPRLRERHGIEIRQAAVKGWNPYVFAYREGGEVMNVEAELLPEYAAIVREKILDDVLGSPLWYAGILARRVSRVLVETEPLEVRLGVVRASIAVHGWILLTVAAALAVAFRMRWFLPLLVFTLAPSASAIMMYSGHGATSQSIYHFLCAAFAAACLGRLARVGVRRSARRAFAAFVDGK